jgi:membrane peptidoglycan carboxypeptidase
MRKTLAMSLNIPAIKTLRAVGIDNAISMAHRLGITTLNDRKRYGLSLAIGGAEVSPLDLTGAFSVFANDGVKSDVHAIREIRDKNDNGHIFEIKKEGVLNPQIARKINSILSDNEARTPIFGPRSPLYIPGKVVAAKTGTSQEFRDAWTVGYTPSLAVGVWAGNNDSHPMAPGADGIFVAAPIWRSFMDQALNHYPSGNFISYESGMENKAVALEPGDKEKMNRWKEEKKADKKKDKKS